MTTSKFVEQFTEAELFAALKLNPLDIEEEDIKEAKNGNLEMQYKIAQNYHRKYRHAHARAWSKILTAKGHAKGMFLLGELYYLGTCGQGPNHYPSDVKAGEELFDQACQKDPIDTPFAVGQFYERCSEYDKAVKFYTIAAENGNVNAQFWLGGYYNVGPRYGVRRDQCKALEWFEKSADQGHALSVKKVKALNNEGFYSSQKLKDAMEDDENENKQVKRAQSCSPDDTANKKVKSEQ